MTTQAITTTIGNIPSPNNWDGAECGCSESSNQNEPNVLFLEKALDGRVSQKDISGALSEYKRLFKAGIASPAELLTLSRAYPETDIYTKALAKQKITDDDKLVIGGPASIELVDREGHLITTDALSKAFDKYMENFRTRNAMVLHSDVQVGWALPAYISKSGQIFKSGVDNKGLFFITELRNDTKISKKVQEQINSGKLKSYSIAGSAIKTQNIQKGLQEVMQVDELELAEVTVCEKGVNQGASFDIIKSNGAATSSCIDGSCLTTEDKEEPQGVELMLRGNGDINFTKSFLNYMKKESLDGTAVATLYNTQGRQEEHHRLLDKLGFPGELEAEYARHTPVIEEDPSPMAHNYVPWVVNEAGQNLGMRHYDDSLTQPMSNAGKKRGVIEGGNSFETPVSQLNTAEGFNNLLAARAKEKMLPSGGIEITISKAQDFFNWMENAGKHIYKEACPCESCFQKSSNYRGVVEKEMNFLA